MYKYAQKRILNYFFYISLFVAITSLFLIIPFIVGIIYFENIILLLKAYIIPCIIIFIINILINRITKPFNVLLKDAMFICTLSWLFMGILGSIPFIIITNMQPINAIFETVSGFTTTGITLFENVEILPHSILIWRSITQWIGGIGILSMFILLGFKSGLGIHKFFFSETHKIAMAKPYPGIFHTIKIMWYVYISLTFIMFLLLFLLKVDVFSAFSHSLTTVSTGGFSIYNNSIAHFSSSMYDYSFLIKLIFIIFMIIGSLNFFVIYNIISIKKINALWKNFEIKHFWLFLIVAILIINFGYLITQSFNIHNLKNSIFYIVSIITSSGFTLNQSNINQFAEHTKFVFLILMFIGGNSGSTSGGFKIIRIAILFRLLKLRLFRINTSPLITTSLVIDKHIIDKEEINRISIMLFLWLLLILIFIIIILLFSNLSIIQSLSLAVSSISNIGPTFIDKHQIISLSPIIKLTAIFIMIAGRLEIFPIIILFNKYFFK